MSRILNAIGMFLSIVFLLLMSVAVAQMAFSVEYSRRDAAMNDVLFYFGFATAAIGLGDLRSVRPHVASVLRGLSVIAGFATLVAIPVLLVVLGKETAVAATAALFGCLGCYRALA